MSPPRSLAPPQRRTSGRRRHRDRSPGSAEPQRRQAPAPAAPTQGPRPQLRSPRRRRCRSLAAMSPWSPPCPVHPAIRTMTPPPLRPGRCPDPDRGRSGEDRACLGNRDRRRRQTPHLSSPECCPACREQRRLLRRARAPPWRAQHRPLRSRRGCSKSPSLRPSRSSPRREPWSPKPRPSDPLERPPKTISRPTATAMTTSRGAAAIRRLLLRLRLRAAWRTDRRSLRRPFPPTPGSTPRVSGPLTSRQGSTHPGWQGRGHSIRPSPPTRRRNPEEDSGMPCLPRDAP